MMYLLNVFRKEYSDPAATSDDPYRKISLGQRSVMLISQPVFWFGLLFLTAGLCALLMNTVSGDQLLLLLLFPFTGTGLILYSIKLVFDGFILATHGMVVQASVSYIGSFKEQNSSSGDAHGKTNYHASVQFPTKAGQYVDTQIRISPGQKRRVEQNPLVLYTSWNPSNAFFVVLLPRAVKNVIQSESHTYRKG